MSTSPHTAESVQRYLAGWIAKEGISATVEADVRLEDLELDSLTIVDLSQALKKDLGIFVPPREMLLAMTVDDVIGIVLEHSSATDA